MRMPSPAQRAPREQAVGSECTGYSSAATLAKGPHRSTFGIPLNVIIGKLPNETNSTQAPNKSDAFHPPIASSSNNATRSAISSRQGAATTCTAMGSPVPDSPQRTTAPGHPRSEEHTSELQS